MTISLFQQRSFVVIYSLCFTEL